MLVVQLFPSKRKCTVAADETIGTNRRVPQSVMTRSESSPRSTYSLNSV
jgi:hypothetical protein